MRDDKADGPKGLIEMKTARFSVVRPLHDNDRKRVALRPMYWSNIAGTISDLQT